MGLFFKSLASLWYHHRETFFVVYSVLFEEYYLPASEVSGMARLTLLRYSLLKMAAVLMHTCVTSAGEREREPDLPVGLVWIHRSILGTSLLESREEREKNTRTLPDRKSAMN